MRKATIGYLAVAFIAWAYVSWPRAALAADVLPVTIRIDAAKSPGELKPVWRFFGYDECNYTYMKDGQKLLTELSRIGPDPVYIRCHHLLTSGDGSPALKWGSTNVYTEDAQGNPVYDWTIVDRIFDAYVHRGLKPYAQLGFMPKDLSTHPELYPTTIDPNKRIAHDAGVAYPPKDYNKWRELARRWVLHCVKRYGADEVKTWYWEVWNEPNISYWRGTREEFYKLYDYAVDGIRSADPTARVGGPETAGDAEFTRRFLEHCLRGDNAATGGRGTPIDFVSFHAKGRPRYLDKHVRMGMGEQLAVIDANFRIIGAYPELKGIPVVIGESDPEGMAARLPSEAPEVGYRNTTLFSSYTAACIAREYDLADAHGVNLVGALTWSFEFEGKPYFPGFRVLSSNGIDHPVMNVFRMLGKMGGKRLAVESSAAVPADTIIRQGVRGEQPDVSALAGITPTSLAVLAWNYHDDDVPGPAADVKIELSSLPYISGDAMLTRYRIDETHSNAYTVWLRMGSPQSPSAAQYAALERAGQLATIDPPQAVKVDGSRATLSTSLPRQAVELLVLSWK